MKETYKRKLPKLDLNITNRCNFRCKHCAFDSGIIKMPELSLGELEKILKETKQIGGKRVDITGGEPLLYNLNELTFKLNQNGFSTHLETSGAYPLTGSWSWICLSPKKFKISPTKNALFPCTIVILFGL